MASDYGSEAGVKLIFGDDAVNRWLDLDNDDVADAGRFAAANSAASDELDDEFRGMKYREPPIVTAAGATPGRVVYLCDCLIGLYLYRAFGSDDAGTPDGRLTWVQPYVAGVLQRLRVGETKLDAI